VEGREREEEEEEEEEGARDTRLLVEAGFGGAKEALALAVVVDVAVGIKEEEEEEEAEVAEAGGIVLIVEVVGANDCLCIKALDCLRDSVVDIAGLIGPGRF